MLLRYLVWGVGGGVLWSLLAVAKSPDAFALWHGPAAGVGFATLLWGTEEYRRASARVDRWTWVCAGLVAALILLAARIVTGPVTAGEILWRLAGGAALGFWARGIAQREAEERRTRLGVVARARSVDEIGADVKWAMKGMLVPAITLTVVYSAIVILGDSPTAVLWMLLAALWAAVLLGAPVVGLLRPRLVGPLGHALVFSVAALPVGAVIAPVITSSLEMGAAATLGLAAAGAVAGVMYYLRFGATPR